MGLLVVTHDVGGLSSQAPLHISGSAPAIVPQTNIRRSTIAKILQVPFFHSHFELLLYLVSDDPLSGEGVSRFGG